MIFADGKCFVLQTDNTEYIFCVTKEGLIEHLHYGACVGAVESNQAHEDSFRAMTEKVSHFKGNTVNYTKDTAVSCEDMLLEVSSLGKGDYREPFVILQYADGSKTSDFVYDSYEIMDQPLPMETLPTAIADGDQDVKQLKIILKEKVKPVRLELYYTVYPHCDVITRRTLVVNTGDEPVLIHKVMSTQLDLDNNNYKLTTFGGHWGREMQKVDTPVKQGSVVNRSINGTTSNRNNSFVMLTDMETGERNGEGYGFHLLYSGNHYESAGASGFYKTRFLSGIDATGFCWTLEPGTSFEAPEAAMTFTDKGYAGISEHMHAFIRRHIVRGLYKNQERPVLLNSWEAAYFGISESKLVNLAKKAKEAGMELLVMDDGWFKGRNDDSSSLGDWTPDEKKLPAGVGRLAGKIHELGLKFGIWVEPEMVNENSDLFRAHPEYAMRIPGRENSLGRNQMLLDLTNPQVVEYIKASMRKVFSTPGIDYVKWDMNRPYSDVYSGVLPADRQGETMHRQILGLYDIVRTLTSEFPNILFEGCSAGGNRFDPGMLCYMPQIWASDDTDALMRTKIQTGYSYGYPMSVITAHVSDCPNHQTLRNTPLETRYNIALFGNLGYELNLCEIKSEEFESIKVQVELYKKWRAVLQQGDFYRANDKEWICVSPDKSSAVCVIWNELVEPNDFYKKLRTVGLDDKKTYHVYNLGTKLNIKQFGDLINQVAPIHIRKDSLLQEIISKFVKLDGEVENYTVSGALLNNSGIKLCQGFGGTGQNNETRMFQDFASRLYYIEEA